MKGLMQRTEMTVPSILEHGAKWHRQQTLISVDPEGNTSTFSYGDLLRDARACTAMLRQQGVKQGSIVATMQWNTRRHMECWYGIMGAGAVCHTLNPRLFEDDLVYIINHAEDVVLLFDFMFAPLIAKMRARLPTVKAYIVTTDEKHMPQSSPEAPLLCYDTLMAAAASAKELQHWADIKEDDACGMCFTSGTTGRPKGVVYSHRSNFLHAMKLGWMDVAQLSCHMTCLMLVPMFHANSWGLAFGAPMFGARLILPGCDLKGASLHRMICEHGVSGVAGVPTLFTGLLQHIRENNLGLGKLTDAIVGGAPMPPSMLREFAKHGVRAISTWGMTELSPAGTQAYLKPGMDEWDDERQETERLKAGWPAFLTDLRIIDDNGKELPHDGVAFGTLQARGPHTVHTYHKADAPAADADGWFSSGDVANIDEYGFVQIVDRSKDVVKSGGEWISSLSIESAASTHEQVEEAAVIAIPNEKWGERPLLLIVPKPGQEPTEDSILAHLKGRVAKMAMPDRVVFLPELPHTATGKVWKLKLRQEYATPQPAPEEIKAPEP